MRALLKPVVARELGIVLLKPGSELMSLFSCERVLVESQPASMERLPAGRVPDVRQPLASDDSLWPFFLDEKVIKAAGGFGCGGPGRRAWVTVWAKALRYRPQTATV